MNDYYSEYLKSRRPNKLGETWLRKWHGRMLARIISDLNIPVDARILEVGPGHGYFAEAAVQAGLNYCYADISEAIHLEMQKRRIVGYLGPLNGLSGEAANFDVVYMSHILEHSTSWADARDLTESAYKRLRPGGLIVVISPDISSYRWNFWTSDWSHGFPTGRRNVVQLLNDVGFTVDKIRYHRNGRFNRYGRFIPALVSWVPSGIVDAVLTRDRYYRGEGFFYSWKTMFGWRQIFIVGIKHPES